MKEWLEIAGIDQDNFNRHTLIEMTEVDALQNSVIGFNIVYFQRKWIGQG